MQVCVELVQRTHGRFKTLSHEPLLRAERHRTRVRLVQILHLVQFSWGHILHTAQGNIVQLYSVRIIVL